MKCKHIYYVYRGRRLAACDCICPACHSGTDCICEACSHDAEVHIEPGYYNRIDKEDLDSGRVPQHVCKDCGTEVFRNGTVGRFPVRCHDCKAKS